MKHSAEIRADMAEQLARVREMERNGELKLIPKLAGKSSFGGSVLARPQPVGGAAGSDIKRA
jgi:hypothetical protein